MAFAEKTEVSVEKSLAAIIATVRSAGGAQIAQLDDNDRFVIAFTLDGRQVRFTVHFPTPAADEFARVKTNQNSTRAATNTERMARWEQRRRQRMRALLLVIRAKLESVESEVETFEQAFLANIVTSNGLTVHERISGDLALEYSSGSVRPLMLGGPQNG